jgi:RNase P/RNase MRP subunit p29
MNIFARKALQIATVSLLAASAAHAQTAPTAQPTGVRGTVTSFSANALKVHTRDGKDLDVKLEQDTPIRGIELSSISAIKPDSYVGTAAVPLPDGSLKALEVHIFPASMRGAGDGHRPWDLGGNSTMTNGAVGNIVVANGRTITVRYKDGEKKVLIPEDVPVVNIVPGDRSLLLPGTKVVLFARKNADGSLSALFISAGKNGIVPPM